MKKIFAIALALVMVLSMASAFANTTCPTISWDCATYTCTSGTGSVEVVPYVKGNTCGGVGYAFTPSTCAGAVNSEKVFFAVKVTVDADANEDWWALAKLELSKKGLGNYVVGTATTATLSWDVGVVAGLIKAETEVDYMKAGVYYLVYGATGWEAVKAADFDADAAGALISADVTNASTAKVCAKLTSAATVAANTKIAEVRGYDVYYKVDGGYVLRFMKGDYALDVALDKNDKVETLRLVKTSDWSVVGSFKTYNVAQNAFKNDTAEYDWTCDEEGKFMKAVLDTFQFNFGTCITDKAVKANFAWDDKVEACFSWNSNAQAVVNAECVVAIPKTGDVSVVAYAVMAVVAAAGAMLKK